MAWREGMQLYPYQAWAAEAMSEANSLLAFEMGTGKTPTTLYVLEGMRGGIFVNGPGTIVAPASLKWQWAREIEKFTDQRVMVIDGDLAKRNKQYQAFSDDKFNYGYLVMSYNMFVLDWEKHKYLARSFLVADEATALKGYKTKRSTHFVKHREWYRVRLALTGTPVENGKADEIFNILRWVDPEICGPRWRFEEKHVIRNADQWIVGYKNLNHFHKTISGHVLRATHKQPEVAKYLPKVLERDPVVVGMDQATSRVVRMISDHILSDLDDMAPEALGTFTFPDDPDDTMYTSGNGQPVGQMMSKIQALRMLLDHPDALRTSAAAHRASGGEEGSKYALEISSMEALNRLKATPKMDALEEYLKDFLDMDPAYKAVVFSSFVYSAKEIYRRFPESVLFHGGLNPRQRDEAVRRFVSNPDCRIFVSTDAGGYGLDLPQANLVVNYSLPWQAGMLQQRNARIKRASSTWPYVQTQDFVMGGTIEERMLAMLKHKMAVADAIVDGRGISASGGVDSDLIGLRKFLSEHTQRKVINA